MKFLDYFVAPTYQYHHLCRLVVWRVDVTTAVATQTFVDPAPEIKDYFVEVEGQVGA